jgi:hypothetical protein
MNVTLSPEHAKFVATYAALTGYTQEEFASLFLADYLKSLEDSPIDSCLQDTIGSLMFKDRVTAERIQAWLLERVSKDYPLNSIKTRLNSSTAQQLNSSTPIPTAVSMYA